MGVLDAERRAPFGGSPDVGERGRRTQRRILEAALEVFDEVGYQNARIEAITERAGCSRPTFYQYFPSKEDLFTRLGGLLGASLVALTESFPPIASGQVASEDLRAWVGELVDLHGRWAPAFVAFRPALRGDPLLTAGAADLSGQYGKALARSVPDCGGRGSSSAAKPEIVASLVMTMLTGALSIRSSGRRSDSDRSATIDQLTSVLHFGLTAPANHCSHSAAREDHDAESVARGPAGPDSRREVPAVEAALEAAALEMFPRLGVEGTRVDDLCDEAGVAHGTFYRYFPDKAVLFERVAGRAAGAMGALLADLPAACADRRVDAWARDWMITYLDHGAILSVWVEGAPSEAGFSATTAGIAIDLLSPAVEADDRVGGPMAVLAVLSLLDWAPYLVQRFDGFDFDDTQRAMSVILDRLLSPANGAAA